MGEPLADDLMKRPFEPKFPLDPPFGPPTRFSNGTWAVFCAALERATAETEVMHHYAADAVGKSDHGRAVYYSVFRCNFIGETIDLRLKREEWSGLVAEDYGFCQELGREASNTSLDALLDAFLAPSARRREGPTVPAFQHRGLSSPPIYATARFTFAENGRAVVETIDN